MPTARVAVWALCSLINPSSFRKLRWRAVVQRNVRLQIEHIYIHTYTYVHIRTYICMYVYMYFIAKLPIWCWTLSTQHVYSVRVTYHKPPELVSVWIAALVVFLVSLPRLGHRNPKVLLNYLLKDLNNTKISRYFKTMENAKWKMFSSLSSFPKMRAM